MKGSFFDCSSRSLCQQRIVLYLIIQEVLVNNALKLIWEILSLPLFAGKLQNSQMDLLLEIIHNFWNE